MKTNSKKNTKPKVCTQASCPGCARLQALLDFANANIQVLEANARMNNASCQELAARGEAYRQELIKACAGVEQARREIAGIRQQVADAMPKKPKARKKK